MAPLGFSIDGVETLLREWNYLTLVSKYWISIELPNIDGTPPLKINGFNRTHANGTTDQDVDICSVPIGTLP